MGDFKRSFDLWLYILQIQQYINPITSNSMLIYCDFAQAFCEMSDQMFQENEWHNFPTTSSKKKFTIEQLIIIVERILYDVERLVFDIFANFKIFLF